MPNPSSRDQNPALTIHIQSWATPVIGLVMLVLGLAAGFWARPLLEKPEAAATTAPVAQATSPSALVTTAPTVDPTSQAMLQEMMGYALNETRHFRGDANAPVTILEFSDFQ